MPEGATSGPGADDRDVIVLVVGHRSSVTTAPCGVPSSSVGEVRDPSRRLAGRDRPTARPHLRPSWRRTWQPRPWTRATESRLTTSTPHRGRLRRLRDHRRPGPGHDVPVAVPTELRGLLDCPIVGVAVDDWTWSGWCSGPATRSSPPASSSTRRSSPGSRTGCPTCRATSATRAPTSGSPRRSRRTTARCSTWRSRRSCSARWSRAWRRPV